MAGQKHKNLEQILANFEQKMSLQTAVSPVHVHLIW